MQLMLINTLFQLDICVLSLKIKKKRKEERACPGPGLLSLLLSRTSTIWASTGCSPKSRLRVVQEGLQSHLPYWT